MPIMKYDVKTLKDKHNGIGFRQLEIIQKKIQQSDDRKMISAYEEWTNEIIKQEGADLKSQSQKKTKI